MQVCTCDVCGATLEVHGEDHTCAEAEDKVCPVCKSEVLLAITDMVSCGGAAAQIN